MSRVYFFENADRDRGHCGGFFAVRNDGEPGTRQREDHRRGARAGNGNVRANTAVGRRPPELVADRLRRPEQPGQAAHINGHEIVAIDLEPR